MSVGSEATNQQGVDDSSNDALVIVDDAHSGFPPGQSPPPQPPLYVSYWNTAMNILFNIYYWCKLYLKYR